MYKWKRKIDIDSVPSSSRFNSSIIMCKQPDLVIRSADDEDDVSMMLCIVRFEKSNRSLDQMIFTRSDFLIRECRILFFVLGQSRLSSTATTNPRHARDTTKTTTTNPWHARDTTKTATTNPRHDCWRTTILIIAIFVFSFQQWTIHSRLDSSLFFFNKIS